MPAHIANAVCLAPTSQTPFRVAPPMIAMLESNRGARAVEPSDRATDRWRVGHCGQVGPGQVGEDRYQVAVDLGGVGRLQPLVELLEVQPPLARGLAQDLGHPVPVGVGDPDLLGVGHPDRVVRFRAATGGARSPAHRCGSARAGAAARRSGRSAACGGRPAREVGHGAPGPS